MIQLMSHPHFKRLPDGERFKVIYKQLQHHCSSLTDVFTGKPSITYEEKKEEKINKNNENRLMKGSLQSIKYKWFAGVLWQK